MLNYNQAVGYIHSLERFGAKLGTENIKKLLALLGNPQEKLKFIHVGGTNGKGSVVTMCAKAFESAGYKTALYTSPFVTDFRERFQINSRMIPKVRLAELVDRVKASIGVMNQNGGEITEFEAVTAIAILYFAEENCDIVCFEVGLGGRFDATNVINVPLVSVITSVSLDHTEILGDSVEKIAFEKCGIIKKGGVTVTYPLQDDSALDVIMRRCAEENNRLILPNASSVKIRSCDICGSEFIYGGESYRISLVGRHQVFNAVTAIEAVRAACEKGFCVPESALKSGLESARIPARFELLSKSPLTVLDGAHNFEGISALKNTLLSLNQRNIIAVTAMMKDKEYEKSYGEILPVCQKVITVSASNPRSLSADEAANAAKKFCRDVFVAGSVAQALELAKKWADENTLILIFGSLFLAGDVKWELSKSEDK